MKQIALILIFTLLSGNSVFTQSGNKDGFDLAIQNVDVFDSKNKTVLKNKTILINGDTIASIIDSKQKFKASKTIKGKGKLVIPGFVDTHTHFLQTYGKQEFNVSDKLDDEVLESFKRLTARQYLSNGTTTIIDMAHPEKWVETTVEFQKNPTPDYPNYYINGSSTISDLSWDRNTPIHHEKIFSAEDGRKKVQKYARLGIRHMKLYWKLELEDMKAVVDEAKKYDITLNAHVDNNIVTIPQAMNLGVKNFEHFFTLVPSVLNFREVFPAFQKKFGVDDNWNIDKFAANMVFHFKYIEDDAELNAKLLSLFDRMAKEEVSISTALNVLATPTGKANTFSTFDSIPPRNKSQTNYSDEQKKQLNESFDSMMKYMKVAHEKGVKLRIGTDTRYGGDAFISELLLFSEAGFPIGDTLQIATINAAEAMKIDDKFGSIEVGKKADLVMFEKSPFDDYKNFQSAKTVIKGGKVFKQETSVAYSLLDVINKKGIESAQKWFRKHKNSGKYGEVREAEMNEIAFQLFAKSKVREAIAVNRLKKQEFPVSGKVYNGLTEDNINAMGYNYLQNDDAQTALELFKFNVENHPNSANVYDSLGEAYLGNKENELALKNYKKSVELNADNYNAIQIINELEGREIKVDSELLNSYVGKYEYRPEVFWNIGIEGNKLTFQETGQNKFVLEAISDERFVIPRSSSSISFEKNSDGKVIGLIFNQGGRLLKAKRVDSNQ